MKTSLLVLSVSCFFVASSSQAWDLNDVTYLLPLPTLKTDQKSVKASEVIPRSWFTESLKSDEGLSLSILPMKAEVLTKKYIAWKDRLKQESVQNQIEHQTRNNGQQESRQQQQQQDDQVKLPEISIAEYEKRSLVQFESLRLVAFRIDPCFKDRFEESCRKQVRAVWQPIAVGERGPSAQDAAVHTFYDLPAVDFRKLLEDLKALKQKYSIRTKGLPLQVHPGFVSAGFQAEVYQRFKLAMKNEWASRIAFMQLKSDEFSWTFLSFNIQKGQFTPVSIPNAKEPVQAFLTSSPVQGIVDDETIPALHLDHETRSKMNDQEASRFTLSKLLEVENPKKNLPGTVDCLSCHVAVGTIGRHANLLGLKSFPTVARQLELRRRYPLTNTSEARADFSHFRAVGYVFEKTAISDRVINESALVADSLNLDYKFTKFL